MRNMEVVLHLQVAMNESGVEVGSYGLKMEAGRSRRANIKDSENFNI